MSDTIEAPAAEPDDIRGSLEKAFAEVDAREAEPEPEKPAVDRPRDEQGRFAKTQAEEDADAAANLSDTKPAAAKETDPKAAAPEGQAAAPEKGTEVAKPEGAPAGLEPPKNMLPAEREAFAKAPPEIQAWVMRRHQEREADYTKKTMEVARYKTVINDFQPVAEMFAPHRQVLHDKGFTPASLIKGWHDTEMAMADPRRAPETVAKIMRGYNVQPQDVLRALGIQMPTNGAAHTEPGAETEPAAPNGGQQSYIPPELVQKIDGLIQWANQSEAQREQERQSQQMMAQQRVVTEIERFAKETDAAGNLKRPHFEAVQDDMALIANGIRQKGGDIPPLAELYDTAVRMNPITYARLEADKTAAQEAQRVATERKQAEEARARASKAQRASAPVRGAPGTGHADPRANGELSRIDDLSATYDALMSNG